MSKSHTVSHMQRLPTVTKFQIEMWCAYKMVNVFHSALSDLQDSDLHHHLWKCWHSDNCAAAAKPSSHTMLWIPNSVCPAKSHIVTLMPLLRSQSVMEVSTIQICDNPNSDPNPHPVPSVGWSHSRGPCGAWSQSLSTDNDQVPAPGRSFSGRSTFVIALRL